LENFLSQLDPDITKLQIAIQSEQGHRDEIAANLRDKSANPYRDLARSKEREEKTLSRLIIANEKQANLAERAAPYGDEVPEALSEELAAARAAVAQLKDDQARERAHQAELAEQHPPAAPVQDRPSPNAPAPTTPALADLVLGEEDPPAAPPTPTPPPAASAAPQADQPMLADIPDAPDARRSSSEPGAADEPSPAPPTDAPEPDAESAIEPVAEPPLPTGMTPERRAELVEAMTLLAPAMFHAGAGDPARYAAEGIDNTLAHGDTPVTREEWDWAEAWAQLHPEIADGDRNGITTFYEGRRARIEAVAQARRDDAQRISTEASQAWKSGDTDRAHQF
ncbi:MAG: hypothetical protein ACRDXB_22500, partial [Actinomycetes bacterium]